MMRHEDIDVGLCNKTRIGTREECCEIKRFPRIPGDLGEEKDN